MNTTENTMTVANEILAQLGGHRFLAMTGATKLVGGSDLLQFRLPRGSKDGINSVRITLDVSDTYTVSFTKVGPYYTVTTVAELSFVYGDQLRSVFESYTGLRTSL